MREDTWHSEHLATTLTLVEGLSRAEVGAVVQADLGSERLTRLSDAWATPEQHDGRWVHPVQLYEAQGWVVLVEPNGAAGLREEMTRALSSAGRLVVLYQGVNAEMRFRYAVEGVVLREFEPLSWPDDQRGEALPEEEGLVFGLPDPEHDPFAEAVTLAERLTGLALTDAVIVEQERSTVLAPSRY